jgi:hypothetical protein
MRWVTDEPNTDPRLRAHAREKSVVNFHLFRGWTNDLCAPQEMAARRSPADATLLRIVTKFGSLAHSPGVYAPHTARSRFGKSRNQWTRA